MGGGGHSDDDMESTQSSLIDGHTRNLQQQLREERQRGMHLQAQVARLLELRTQMLQQQQQFMRAPQLQRDFVSGDVAAGSDNNSVAAASE